MTIQQYEIREKLGSGGMGDVYKARDTKLNRYVAVKALPEDKAGDPERRKRFLYEARAASALSHPNIITIHDILTQDGADYLVMEYVPGKTLAELIPEGGLRADQALSLATQVASGLAAAHKAGIIHRDLKPGNIMVTAGHVKLLDFGLAKQLETGNESPTRTALTMQGAIIGTAAYMSPEQAEGKPIDARSDIFSFGTVLYEMVTGQRTFAGESPLSTLTSVLRDEPRPIQELVEGVPTELERLIARCLRKDPARRWQNMEDLYLVLAELKAEFDSGQLIPRTHTGSTWVGTWSPAALAARSAAAASEPEPPAPPPPPPPAPDRTHLVLVVCGILLAAGAAVWFLANRTVIMAPAPPPPEPAASREAPPVTKPPASVSQVPAPVPGTPEFSPTAIPLKPDMAPLPAPKPVIPPAAAPGVPAEPETKPAAAKGVTLPDGYPIPLILMSDVTTELDERAPLTFAAASDIAIDGQRLIRKGSPGSGTVAEVKKKFLRRGSRVMISFAEVKAVDGKSVRLRVAAAGKEPSRAAEVPGSKGERENVVAAKGTHYIAYADGDVEIAPLR